MGEEQLGWNWPFNDDRVHKSLVVSCCSWGYCIPYCWGKQLHFICIKYRPNNWEGTHFILEQRKEHRKQRKYIKSVSHALLTAKMQGEVDKHADLDAQFVPSHVAKHTVPKKFSTKTPTQEYKDLQGPTSTYKYPLWNLLDQKKYLQMRMMRTKLMSGHNQWWRISVPMLLEMEREVTNLMMFFRPLLNQQYPKAELCLPEKDTERKDTERNGNIWVPQQQNLLVRKK